MSACPFCRPAGETVLWRDARCRVLLADEPGYPGFCRVVWGEHVAEMTDLAPADRCHLMAVVFGVEAALREVFEPTKVNLASLGNQVPHLHWHVIARFADDPHYPGSIWGEARRAPLPSRGPDLATLKEFISKYVQGAQS